MEHGNLANNFIEIKDVSIVALTLLKQLYSIYLYTRWTQP